MQTDFLPAEPQGKPKNTGVGSLSLIQGLFPTEEFEPCSPVLLAGYLPTELSGNMAKGKQGKDLAMLVGDWHQAISYLCLQAMISHILITSVRNLYKMFILFLCCYHEGHAKRLHFRILCTGDQMVRINYIRYL